MPNPSIGLPISTRPFLLFPLASLCPLLCLNVKQNQEGWGQNKKIKLSYEGGKILLEMWLGGSAGRVPA